MADDRSKRGFRDLILSMAVVAVFVAFLFAVVWRPTPEAVKPVETKFALEAARSQADYPVLFPQGLPAGWTPTSARFEGSTWFLGYVTPEQQYVAVTQTDGDAAEFVKEQTLEGQPDGSRTIAGQQWQQYVAGDQRSLVRTGNGSTTVVTGTVDYDQLQAFVEKLQS